MAKTKRAPANPDKFEEASKWFRARTPVTRAEWDSMTRLARRQAFTVAGTQRLKVVQAVFDELQKAIDKGTPLEQWQKAIAKRIKGDFTKANASNLTTAFINANQTAYNTGRWFQLNDPSVTASMPYWLLDVVLDQRTSEICTAMAGTVLPHDDPWWLTHFPQFHHRCRTTVRALTTSQAKRRGISEEKPRPNIPDDWGLAPPLRAGQVWEPKREDFDPSAWAIYVKSQERMKAARAANDNATPAPKK